MIQTAELFPPVLGKGVHKTTLVRRVITATANRASSIPTTRHGQRRRRVSHERRHRLVHGKEGAEGAALLGEGPHEGHFDQTLPR